MTSKPRELRARASTRTNVASSSTSSSGRAVTVCGNSVIAAFPRSGSVPILAGCDSACTCGVVSQVAERALVIGDDRQRQPQAHFGTVPGIAGDQFAVQALGSRFG